MQSSSPTDESDAAGEPTRLITAEAPLAPQPLVHERCAMCSATLASDQRYCVECGQRCGAARLPFTDGLTQQRAQQAPTTSQSHPERRRMSVNSTLIAGIGTLLLAMGVGVLIGRSSTPTSSKAPAVQVVTVPGAGSASGSSGESPQAPTAAAKTATPGAAATKAAKSTPKAAAPPPAKVVKVGSAGKGPGYQHGHFTGNFFGQ
jgi:hypothetical protein